MSTSHRSEWVYKEYFYVVSRRLKENFDTEIPLKISQIANKTGSSRTSLKIIKQNYIP